MNTKKLFSNSSKVSAPYPVFCRGHSGGRIISEAFIKNGIEMGEVHSSKKDTHFFAAEHPRMHELILNSYQYLSANDKKKEYYQNLLRTHVEEFHENEIKDKQAPFGWKMGVSTFTMLMTLDAYPNSKVIHLIRDGRDVMLSRLDARMNGLHDPVNRLAVFGDPDVSTINDEPLAHEVIEKHRNELEMMHWVTSVEYGMKGREYADRYLEVKYEDICTDPIPVFEKIFDFLGISFLDETREWLKKSVSIERIGKWKKMPKSEIEKAIKIGEPLLEKLGYK